MLATRNVPFGLLDMLVGEGLISSSAAIGIRNRIRESWIPLGEVLRQQGNLSTAQLMDLVQMQACEPHFRLGELAVREGLCSERDILDAIQLQRESNPHALEILLSEIECDRERLWRVVIRYVRQIESRIAELPVQI
jgi:hypothetical protein